MKLAIECCQCNHIFEHQIKNHYKDVFDCPKCNNALESHLKHRSKLKIALIVLLEVAGLLPIPFLGQINRWLRAEIGDSVFLPLLIVSYLCLVGFAIWSIYRKYIRPLQTVVVARHDSA